MKRPQWNRQKVEEILAREFAAARRKQPKVVWFGVRGYFEDSMGKPDQNDRGIYDDAFFLISPVCFKSFNANTDPSRSGTNKNIGKGYPVLQPGIYDYKIGIHGLSRPKDKQYRALVQAGQVTIKRDGSDKTERGFFCINGHRGGINGTSSEGCQTTLRDQWPEFFETAESELVEYGQNIIPYCLIEQQG